MSILCSNEKHSIAISNRNLDPLYSETCDAIYTGVSHECARNKSAEASVVHVENELRNLNTPSHRSLCWGMGSKYGEYSYPDPTKERGTKSFETGVASKTISSPSPNNTKVRQLNSIQSRVGKAANGFENWRRSEQSFDNWQPGVQEGVQAMTGYINVDTAMRNSMNTRLTTKDRRGVPPAR